MDTLDIKDNLNWKIGTSRLYEAANPTNGEMDGEYLKRVLSHHDSRSRFIRGLEVESIVARDPEDLAKRYHEEEILPRRASSVRHNSRSNRT